MNIKRFSRSGGATPGPGRSMPCHWKNRTWRCMGPASDILKQESRAVAREPRDAAAVVFGLTFADNIHYKFKSSQASKAI